jgi:ParB family chromosome partitioning protein
LELRFIEVSRIVEDPEQPRRALDDSTLAGLADSIRQHGVLNPITVAPLAAVDGFRIVTGERRWRASQLAGLNEMPCLVREEAPVDENDKRAEQLIENLQREELAPLDKAQAIKILKDRLGGTNREIGQRLGISERTIGYLLDLLDLPESIGEQIISSPNRPADGNLTEKHGRFLRQLNDQPDLQAHLVEKIRGEKLSADDTGKIAKALRANPDRRDEILGADIDELPRVLGYGKAGETAESAPPFSAGRAFVGLLDRSVSAIAEVKIDAVSAGDIPALEESAQKVKTAIDMLLAQLRAARNL